MDKPISNAEIDARMATARTYEEAQAVIEEIVTGFDITEAQYDELAGW